MARKKRKFTTKETSDSKSSASKKKAKVTSTEPSGSKPPSPIKKRKSTTKETSDFKGSASKKAKVITTEPLGSKTPSPKKKKKADEDTSETKTKKKKRDWFYGRPDQSPPEGYFYAFDNETSKDISPNSKNRFRERLKATNSAISEAELTETGAQTQTPKKRALTAVLKFGFLILYEIREKAPEDAKIITRSTSHILNALEVERKTQKASLSKNSVKKVKTETKGKKRNPTQNKAMGKEYGKPEIPAKEAAEAANFDTKNIEWEWGHLIAHHFLGDKEAQKSDNLVLMTKDCNTLMMYVEKEIDKLITQLFDDSSTIELEVTSDLDVETHVAEKIVYHIKSNDSEKAKEAGKALQFDLKLEFNPLSTYRPPRTMQDIAKDVFAEALERKKPMACVHDKTQLVYDGSPSAKNKAEKAAVTTPDKNDKAEIPNTSDKTKDDQDDFKSFFMPRNRSLLKQFNKKTTVEDEVSQAESLKKVA